MCIRDRSRHVILAGDDDQAIYGWAGADVERFQKEPGKERVLPKSYRVPQSIQSIANKILDRIPNQRRILKTWQPRKETGNIYPESYSLQEIPLQEGGWLVLARTNYRLINLIPDLNNSFNMLPAGVDNTSTVPKRSSPSQCISTTLCEALFRFTTEDSG